MMGACIIFLLFAAIITVAHSYYLPTTGVDRSSSDDIPIVIDMQCFQQTDKVLCQFDYTNVAQQDYYLLKRNTALAGLYSPFLTVKHGESTIEYQGYLFNCFAPSKGEYVLIQAGSTISSPMIHLTQAYKLPYDGLYTIQYTGQLAYLPTHWMAMLQDGDVAQNHIVHKGGILAFTQVVVTDSGNLEILQGLETTEALNQLHDYEEAHLMNGECETPRVLILSEGIRRQLEDEMKMVHRNLCPNIKLAMQATNEQKTVFSRWFGVDTDTAKVEKVFQESYNNIIGNEINYRLVKNTNYCNSNPNCPAYVNRNIYPRDIFICVDLYDNPMIPIYCRNIAEDTRERILVHELTHLFSGTKDLDYGIEKCEALAKSVPSAALVNADNFSYFYCEVTEH